MINAGGIVNVAAEYFGNSSEEQVRAEVGQIPARLDAIFAEAKATKEPTNRIADRMARRIVAGGANTSMDQTSHG